MAVFSSAGSEALLSDSAAVLQKHLNAAPVCLEEGALLFWPKISKVVKLKAKIYQFGGKPCLCVCFCVW